MTSPAFGDQRPPENPVPDPALAGYPPPSPFASAADPQLPAQPVYPPPAPGQRVPAYAPPADALPTYAPQPVGPMPTEPVPYTQLLRGPTFRWWKPLVTLLLAVAMYIPLALLSFMPLLVMGLATGAEDLGLSGLDVKDLSPTGFVVVNLSLIVLIPIAGLSIWCVHRIRPRYLSSVAGGIRWRWLWRCVLFVLPVWLAYIGLSLLVAPPTSPRPAAWLVLLAIVLVMTPFQSAAEEYFFRGWFMQNIGAWFARPVVGLVVSVAVSAVVFSAGHGSPDPWILVSIACLTVASGVAAYRTGGLEAGIAMHAVNNMLAFGAVLIFGGWEQAFVGADTEGSPVGLALSVAVFGAALALILWQAKRHGIESHYRPSNRSATAADPAGPASPVTGFVGK